MLYSRFAWAVTTALSSVSALSTDIETGSQKELDLSILIKHKSPPHPVDMRLPPTFDIATKNEWTPTPGQWFLGTWYFTHSNQVEYQAWKNMQWTLSARPNNSFDDTLNDLTSFQLLSGNDTTTVWNIYGVDTRTIVDGHITRDCYNFLPAGAFASSNLIWEVIAWGYDSRNVPYAVLYETPFPGGQPTGTFDIISRSDCGPGQDTLQAIYEAVADLKNKELSDLLAVVKPLEQNGARNWLPYPTCDAVCMTNVINPFGL